MSKSRHNGADPGEVLAQYGADATRLCILSGVSPQSHRKWSSEAFTGIVRWQGRIWRLVGNYISAATTTTREDHCDSNLLADWEAKLFEARNYTVKEVTFHCSKTFLLNTAVSRMQKFTTTLGKVPGSVCVASEQYAQCLADLCIMLAPLAPCFASELWAGLASVCQHRPRLAYHWDKTLLDQTWPVIDTSYKLPLIFKINHQDNGDISVTSDVLDTLTCDLAHDLVRAQPKYQQYCEGRDFEAIDFSVHPGYQAVINFIPKKQATASVSEG
ncbi:hypothetical protein ACOMHN_006364 [Nucella lapillus]